MLRERVRVTLLGSEPFEGYIDGYWDESSEAKMTGYYHLDKYLVHWTDANSSFENSGWFYGCDIQVA